MEFKAPGVIDRQPVKEPLQTGIKAIDSMIPIGRGQRELIIGDRGTGKTAIALDTIINQKGQDVICIYVAIGQKASTVAGLVAKLEEQGAMDYTIVVMASASAGAPLRYIAPYAGAAMGEYFTYTGRHALCIYDDLTKHADTYRQMSLLLRRPPGREAFPGDIFYLHSRLLERGCKLSDKQGGGSLTALPIIETQAGRRVRLYPHQRDLYHRRPDLPGGRPVLLGHPPGHQRGHLGLARGRQRPDQGHEEGGRLAASGPLQFRELEAFAKFGSELDQETQKSLARGERLVASLNQPQYEPWPVQEQVMVIFAATNGYADDVPVADISAFNAGLRDFLGQQHPEIGADIAKSKDLSPENEAALRSAIEAFKEMWIADKGLV